VFDLFDFWDGRDSMVDAYKVGDFLRCCGLNPTQALVLANGGSATVGKSRSIAASYYIISIIYRAIYIYIYIYIYTGWAKKTGLFLTVNNFFCA